MFPKIRSKSDKNLDYHSLISPSKSKQWNDRFVLENMPEYSPLKDPHIKKYRKGHRNSQILSSLQQQSSSPLHKSLVNRKISNSEVRQRNDNEKLLYQNLQKKLMLNNHNIFSQRIPKLIEYLEHSFPEYVQQINHFYKVIVSYAIPQFFIYYLLKSYANKTHQKKDGAFDIKGEMSSEIKQVKGRENYYYKIIGCHQARQRCLQGFAKFIKQKVQHQHQVFENKQKIETLIKNLRLITGNLVDLVAKWRQILAIEFSTSTENQEESLQQQWILMPQRAIFYIEKQKHKNNILINLLNDNKFLLSSAVSNCVQMGTKNDPFLLSPLKKAQGKQISEILYLFRLSESEKAHFNSLMQYLANEKAHHIKSKDKKVLHKNLSDVEKIYMHKHRVKMQNIFVGSNSQVELSIVQNRQQGVDSIKEHIKKAKISRMKKNQERMGMIKAVYQGDRNYQKIQSKVENDEIEGQSSKQKHQHEKQTVNRQQLDKQFDNLVNQRYRLLELSNVHSPKPSNQKIKKIVRHQNHDQNTLKKAQQTQQDKMINKLNTLNKQLREKLSEINKETDEKSIGSPKSNSFAGKNNKQIVDQLKKQIISKIEAEEQEKEKMKKKRKEEQDKILTEIKQKMKKQFQDKLNEKKMEKLQQKERLQKMLEDQEVRIKQQRQLQIQMLLKISKQKEMKNLEKLKREALEKQNQLKEQLAKEQLLRKQKQEQIEKQKRQREKLIKQLEMKQLKNEIEREVRQQYSVKNVHEANMPVLSQQQIIRSLALQPSTDRDQADPLQSNVINIQNGESRVQPQKLQKSDEQLKIQRQLQLRKEMTLLKDKQQKEIGLIQQQNQIRKRMLLFKKNEQLSTEKDIDYLMRRKIMLQKQGESTDSNYQANMSAQQQIKRIQVLKKMEEEQQQQKEKQAELNKIRKQRQTEQKILRQKIKQKIQKELKMQAVKRMRQQIDDRQVKQMDRKKMEHQMRTKLFNQEPINQDTILDEEKLKLLESEFLQKQVSQETAKTSLRSQFQKELLASSLPPKFFVEKEFLKVKNTKNYLGEDYLYDKLENTKEGVQKLQQIQHSPLKKEKKVKQHVYELTDQQLYIYKKQKEKNRQNLALNYKNNPLQDQNGGPSKNQFELVRPKDEEVESDRIYVKQYKNGRHINRKQGSDSQDQINSSSKQASTKIDEKKQNKNKAQMQSPDSEDEDYRQKLKKLEQDIELLKSKQRPKKVKKDQKNVKKEQQNLKQQKQTIKKRSGSRESSNKKGRRQIESGKQSVNMKQKRNKDKVENIFAMPQPIKIKKQNNEKQKKGKINSNKFSLQFEAIPESELDHQLQTHFSRIPPNQTSIMVLDRHELYRRLISELTFSIIMGTSENRLAGVAYIHHDRLSSAQTRKFKFSHVATYSNSDLKQFILAVCEFVFLKDPCQQIQFLYIVNQKKEDEIQFVEEIVKWWAAHGEVYQRKVEDHIFERKFVYRRNYQHKCEVTLSGINKSAFNSTIMITSSILVSKFALTEHRQHFASNVQFLAKVTHNLLLSELFRMYLTPEQADKLKNNLKDNTLYKQLLGIILTLQKKKVKIQEYALSEYKSIVQLNMKMMSQGKDPINYVKDSTGQSGNQIFVGQLMWRGAMMCTFQVATLPIVQEQDSKKYLLKQPKIRHISYFRLRPIAPQKLHLLKSSLYNTEIYLLPCQNPKLKILLFSAEQFLAIKQKQLSQPAGTPLTLHNYLRYFMKNISKYNRDSQYEYIWVPEINADKKVAKIDLYKDFYDRHMYLKDGISMSYRQFVPSGLIIQPQHRDLVVTAPFVLGVISMSIEQVLEGCSLYARLLMLDDLRLMEEQ